MGRYVTSFFKSSDGRYRRIRRRPAAKPVCELYEYKKECLSELEALSAAGTIDLFYGDESGFCTEGYVPYGWQFKDEDVYVPASSNGQRLNCFALISRDNRCHWAATTGSINAEFVLTQLDALSWQITKQTVVVLDNASMHRCRLIKDQLAVWRRRGLWLFYLPPYSPQLNCCETLWRMMKGQWLQAGDYRSTDDLFYTTTRILSTIGKQHRIDFAAK